MKSVKTEFTIVMEKEDFDGACVKARAKALQVLEICEDGHCHRFKGFARSESSAKISFHKLEIDMSMIGTHYYYIFKTWMEK